MVRYVSCGPHEPAAVKLLIKKQVRGKTNSKKFSFFLYIFWPQVEVPPSTMKFYTMILQRTRIIAVDAGFEPGTFVPEVWRATNQAPHLIQLVKDSMYNFLSKYSTSTVL